MTHHAPISEIAHCNTHGRRHRRRIRALYRDAESPASFHHQEVELGALVRSPEVGFVGAGRAATATTARSAA